MHFSLSHITRYRYESKVADSFNDAHLCPVSDAFQTCEAFSLLVNPTAGPVLRRLDFYTNQVHHFEVLAPHDSLEVIAQSKVLTIKDLRDYGVSSDPACLPLLIRDEQYYDFLHASDRVALTTPVLHEMRQLELASHDVRLQVERIMEFVFTQFEYSSGATQVETPVERVLELRKGVCQDFAHVMIALCRVAGIPARYVSGYFYTESRRSGTVDDNTASHAWVECYLPGIGWVGYDPTHNRRVNETYIKIAIGRDYVDVRPLAGTYRGLSKAQLYVEVKVERLEQVYDEIV